MIKPHGGTLVNRLLSPEKAQTRKEEVDGISKVTVSNDMVKEIENIATGVFSPLEGFMVFEDFDCVLKHMRLASDVPWTMPILLDVEKDELQGAGEGDVIALVDGDGTPVATLTIEELYGFDAKEYMTRVYTTEDDGHPGVRKVKGTRPVLIGGKIECLGLGKSQFEKYNLRPYETRVLFKEKGWRTVVGFQTRNTPHLGHEYVQKAALTFVDGIFVNPIIGKKKKGDFRDDVILETYQALMDQYYLKDRSVMSILQTEMRYGGPREAIFHAIMRKNFGCSHFIVGRDHAGVGNYYPPFAAHDIFDEFPDLGIVPLFFRAFFYCTKCGGPVNEKICPHSGDDVVSFSGTKIRQMLVEGKHPPADQMRPEVADVILKYDNPFIE